MRDIFYATPKVKSLIKTEKDGVVTIISHGTVDAATPPLEIC